MEKVKSRAGLEHHFDAILNNNYESIITHRKYSYGHNAIKSYVVECHLFKDETSRDSITSTVLTHAQTIESNAKLFDTEDETLVFLTTEKADYYLDFSNKRYIVLHTAEPTKVTDPFIKRFYTEKGFDSLWLPVPLLLQTNQFGRFWGMGVSFRDSIEEPSEQDNDLIEDIQDVSLSVKRHFAKNFFKLLMNSDLNRMMGISRLSVLRSNFTNNTDEENRFIIDDIKYNGKLTAKGNSYAKHSRIVFELVKLYGEAITKLESYGISFDEGFLSGNPITINFSQPVLPEKLVNLVFSGDEPFRLWGIEERLNDHEYRVYAVDMHHGNLGNRIMFEISPHFIRIALPKNSCANTVFRLLANLNHYVDAMADLEVEGYELKVDLSGTGLS
ncbi:hypothetical protein DUZ99_16630 [Xylanibacillus composti]|uniref:Uncharacterized protein n=1 Tax=Xylanibacillus composti TaxID=1572762 RepID=A0A8J4H3W6_9BACL|nr:hypothetical protein [Xylanibacillus composti]MDT9726605.1 hypothetical protein [Xylanibacillus composti]GIQ69027.1 hypothetical protein XYCOK13_18510 [Xylanibacillus composti]